MKLATLAFIAIMSQVIICMLVDAHIGNGYAIGLIIGFMIADFAFGIILSATKQD